MSRVQCYEPAPGYRFQLIARNPQYSRAWEHCDYAADCAERSKLLAEYRLAYGAGWEFRSLELPRCCWPSVAAVAGGV